MTNKIRHALNILMCFLSMTVVATAAQALTLGQYREWQKDPIRKEMLTTYTAGIGQGIAFSNVYNKTKNLPMIFCPPNSLPITGDLTNAVLTTFISKNRFQAGDDISIILIFALQDAYPC
jgi:hypothetical protein